MCDESRLTYDQKQQISTKAFFLASKINIIIFTPLAKIRKVPNCLKKTYKLCLCNDEYSTQNYIFWSYLVSFLKQFQLWHFPILQISSSFSDIPINITVLFEFVFIHTWTWIKIFGNFLFRSYFLRYSPIILEIPTAAI